MSAAASRPQVIGAFILVSLIWGSTWITITTQINSVPPQWSVTWRFLLAAVGMVILAIWRGDGWRIDRRGLRLAALLGLLQFCLNFNFVYPATGYITSGLVAVIFALLILPNAVMARVFLGQRSTGRFWAGAAVASAGVAMLIAHELEVADTGATAALIGSGLTLCAVMCASFANVLQASKTAQSYPTVTLLFWSMLAGTLCNAAFAWASAGPPVIDMSAGYLTGLAWLAVVGSVITFPLYFMLIRAIGAGPAAYTSVIIPVIAMALSTVFEDYHWTLLATGGGVLVLVGMVISMTARKPST